MSVDPHTLLKQAEKALNSAGGGWSLFGNRQDKYDDAAELFTAAAEVFLARNMRIEAGKAFERAGEVYKKSKKENTGFESASACRSYKNAATAYYKVDDRHPNRGEPGANRGDLDSSIRCKKTAIAMYRPQQTHKKTAGDLEKELADLYAGPKQDVNRAVEHYKASSDTYLESESDLTASSTKSLRLAADLASKSAFTYGTIKIDEVEIANVERIDKELLKTAIDLYEAVATASLSTELLRFSVKGYLLSAGLCRIAYAQILTDTKEKGANNEALKNPFKYTNTSSDFCESTEYGILQALASAFETGDRDQFERVVNNAKSMLGDSRKHLVFMLIGMFNEPVPQDHTDHDAVDGPDFS